LFLLIHSKRAIVIASTNSNTCNLSQRSFTRSHPSSATMESF